MPQSANYDATKPDNRSWVADHNTRAGAIDAAGVANAAALQTATRDTTTLTSISVTPATVTLDISDEETQQLTVEQTPSSALASFTYTSSDPTKATVSDTGLITPLVAGETTITVASVADPAITDTCVVTVEA